MRRYPRPIGCNSTSRPQFPYRKLNICTFATDQGVSGWGYCGFEEEEIRAFVGRQVSDLISLESGTVLEARSIDIALHDLAGKILGLPVWKMLGGTQNTIPIYTGAVYFDELDGEGNDGGGGEPVLDSCAYYAEAGHTHFKLKIGRGHQWMDRSEGDQRDIEITRLVRERFPDAGILVDANDGYEPDGFIRYLEAVADCNLYWIEEPFAETADGLQKLRAAVQKLSPDTLVADGEDRNGRLQDPLGHFGKWQADHIDELFELCQTGLLDVILPDVGAMGFTAWRSIMPRLIDINAQGSPHAWSEPFKSWYAAQIGCAYGNVPIIEGVPGSVDGVNDSNYIVNDGILTLPEQPGFGMDLID